MRSGVIRTDPGDEFATEERCQILELLGVRDDPDLSVAQARVERGVATAWHRLEGVDERYLMLAGRGRVELGDDPPAEVGPGDVVLVPQGMRQRIHNTGPGDLVFLCLCTPAFRPECYVHLEPRGA